MKTTLHYTITHQPQKLNVSNILGRSQQQEQQQQLVQEQEQQQNNFNGL